MRDCVADISCADNLISPIDAVSDIPYVMDINNGGKAMTEQTYETSITGKAMATKAAMKKFADLLDAEGDATNAALFREFAHTDRWDVLAGIHDIMKGEGA
jgi:hypothetical protein